MRIEGCANIPFPEMIVLGDVVQHLANKHGVPKGLSGASLSSLSEREEELFAVFGETLAVIILLHLLKV